MCIRTVIFRFLWHTARTQWCDPLGYNSSCGYEAWKLRFTRSSEDGLAANRVLALLNTQDPMISYVHKRLNLSYWIQVFVGYDRFHFYIFTCKLFASVSAKSGFPSDRRWGYKSKGKTRESYLEGRSWGNNKPPPPSRTTEPVPSPRAKCDHVRRSWATPRESNNWAALAGMNGWRRIPEILSASADRWIAWYASSGVVDSCHGAVSCISRFAFIPIHVENRCQCRILSQAASHLSDRLTYAC
jgi:hypothetical protein